MPTSRFALTDTVDNTVVDAVLAALEVHDHGGGDRLRNPSGAASTVLNPVDGTLPGSSTYVYRYALVDRYGFETMGSPEITQSTPAVLAAPAVPQAVSAPGGLLAPGIYFVYLSAMSGAEQTSLSAPTTINLISGEGTIVVSRPTTIPTAVTGFNVWRQGPGEVAPTRIGSLALTDVNYTDAGDVPADDCACDPAKLPPAFNRTNSTNSITVSLSLADAALVQQAASPVLRWRLYRSTTSGGFTATSLLHQVVETDDNGYLLTAWTDDGTASLTSGTPLEQSRTLTPSVAIQSGSGGAGALQVRSGSSLWALTCDLTGHLVTDPSALPLPQGYLYLTSPGSITYRVDVNSGGELFTTAASPAGHDQVFLAGGPVLASPDPTLGFQLTVDDTGRLITTAAGVAHDQRPSQKVGNGAPTTPAVAGSTYFDRTNTYKLYVYDQGAWQAAT